MEGLVAKRFPDPGERAAFRKSEEYGKLHALVEQRCNRPGSRPARADEEWQVRCSTSKDDARGTRREAIPRGTVEPACPGKTRRKVEHTFIGGHGIR